MTAALTGVAAGLARVANRAARFTRQNDDGPPFVEVAGVQVFVYVHPDGALRVSLHFDGAADHPELWPDHEHGVPVTIDVGGTTVYQAPATQAAPPTATADEPPPLGVVDDPDGPDHVIEETAKVYLVWRDGRWVVDGTTVDGYALDGKDDGATCDVFHDDDPAMRDECRRLCDEADMTSLPTGEELIPLLGEALGLT